MRQIWTDSATRVDIPTRFGIVPVVVAARTTTPRGTVLLAHGRNGAPDQAQIA